MIEVELRYKVRDVSGILAILQKQQISLSQTKHIIDEWFAPDFVHDQASQDRWFDVDHGVAYRIRRTEKPDATFDVVLDSKQLTTADNHNTFHEAVLLRNDEVAARAFVEGKKYYNWLTIDKQRRMFTSPDVHLIITMDTIAGVKEKLGVDTVLEIEYEGEGSRAEALKTIRDFAERLGLDSNDLFEKSLTVESMRVLARFK